MDWYGLKKVGHEDDRCPQAPRSSTVLSEGKAVGTVGNIVGFDAAENAGADRQLEMRTDRHIH